LQLDSNVPCAHRPTGTSLSDSWAASGGRLPLRLDVYFDEISDIDDEPILTPFRSSPGAMLSLRPLSENARFVGLHGLTHVPVQAGAARLSPVPYARSSKMQSLRFWLDFGCARHHDVELDAGRVFFFADAWHRHGGSSASTRGCSALRPLATREGAAVTDLGDGSRLACILSESLDLARHALQILEQKVTSLEESTRALKAEATRSDRIWRQLQIFAEERMLADRILNAKIELSRRRSELPADQHDGVVSGGVGCCSLALARKGTICIRRRRPAPFGFLKVGVPIPRDVYEQVGTFTMRPCEAQPSAPSSKRGSGVHQSAAAAAGDP
jgi:hypothetical protein